MRFKQDPSFLIRHKILEYLFNEQEKLTQPNCEKRFGSIDLSKAINVDLKTVHRYHEILKKEKEVDCREEEGQHMMFIMEAGRYAYLENKYKIAGRVELWEYWYQPLKVIVPFLAVVVATIAIIINYCQSKTVEKLNNRLDQLEQPKIGNSNDTIKKNSYISTPDCSSKSDNP